MWGWMGRGCAGVCVFLCVSVRKGGFVAVVSVHELYVISLVPLSLHLPLFIYLLRLKSRLADVWGSLGSYVVCASTVDTRRRLDRLMVRKDRMRPVSIQEQPFVNRLTGLLETSYHFLFSA